MLSLALRDNLPWDQDLVWTYLYQQLESDMPITIDICPEACCLRSAGVYDLLDKFCVTVGYNKTITIKTANMIEYHSIYKIERNAGSWYELPLLQQWLKDNPIIYTTTPSKMFGCFNSRNHWSRLWLSTILYNYYKEKSLLTYHYDGTVINFNYDLYIGIDDLIKRDCEQITQAYNFLQNCPLTLDQINEYPIQHPANMSLLKFYQDLFVDIVSETNVAGNSFLVTEKTWRSIISKRPFIVMSNQGFLHHLKKLGFKTFDFYWSEEYDQNSDKNRIKHIIDLLDQLSKLTLVQVEEMLKDMDDILEHNLSVFNSLSFGRLNEIFNG